MRFEGPEKLFPLPLYSSPVMVCLHVGKTIGTVGQQSEQTPVHGFRVKKVIILFMTRGNNLYRYRRSTVGQRYHTLVHNTTSLSKLDFIKHDSNKNKLLFQNQKDKLLLRTRGHSELQTFSERVPFSSSWNNGTIHTEAALLNGTKHRVLRTT